MAKTELGYAEDERILCFHGPLMYEATIKKAELWTPESNKNGATGPHYLVHYKGWKSTWDEWVPEERAMKRTEENIAKQKKLNEIQLAEDRAERLAETEQRQSMNSKRAAGETIMGGSRGPSKRVREAPPEEEDEYRKRPEIKIWIPDELKVQLVDDWEAITKSQKLVPLPRKPTVQEILADFEEHCKTAKGIHRTESLTHEVVAGLKLYFDKSLGNNLLYRFERQQYGKQRTERGEDAEPSSYYGAEHLLRLFVNLPELIAHTNMDNESVTTLKDALADFLKYMAKEHKRLFVTMKDYCDTTSAYQNQART